MISFSEIAQKYLLNLGYTADVCASEEEAREFMRKPREKAIWPCYFFTSDTTGEKEIEEFYSEGEEPIWDRFVDIGVINNKDLVDNEQLDQFLAGIAELLGKKRWTKADLVQLFNDILTNFSHKETFKYLDDRM